MKKFVFAITAAVILAGPVLAADIPVKARPPVVAAWSWTGCYIGGHGGWQRARVDADYGANTLGQVPGTAISDDLRVRGLTLGGTAGCNYQIGNWVIGVEGDYDFVTKADTRVETAFPAFRVQVEQHGLATARGRIGYAFERGLLIPLPTLYYVTGGGVWARMETSEFQPHHRREHRANGKLFRLDRRLRQRVFGRWRMVDQERNALRPIGPANEFRGQRSGRTRGIQY